MENKTFRVPNISCHHCVHTIRTEVSEVPGVKSVTGDVTTKMVTVSYEGSATWDAVKDKLVEIEYPPEEQKA